MRKYCQALREKHHQDFILKDLRKKRGFRNNKDYKDILKDARERETDFAYFQNRKTPAQNLAVWNSQNPEEKINEIYN